MPGPLAASIASVQGMAVRTCGASDGVRLPQTWPTKPVRLIVNSPPDGASDVMAQLVGVPLGEAPGQTVMVDNKPGGGGLIATEFVAKAAPDGYTLLRATPVNALFPHTV